MPPAPSRERPLLGELIARVRGPAAAGDGDAWDSIERLDIVLAIEEAYGVRLTTGEIVELGSLAAAERALARRGIVA
jgi:acyl carrier protein